MLGQDWNLYPGMWFLDRSEPMKSAPRLASGSSHCGAGAWTGRISRTAALLSRLPFSWGPNHRQ